MKFGTRVQRCARHGCKRQFLRPPDKDWRNCPRCRARDSDARTERHEAAVIEAARARVAAKRKPEIPTGPLTIPEREAIILQWQRAS